MNIDKQYDNEGMANEYAKESMETKENDLGRIFLSEQISKNDKSSFILDIGCGSGIELEEYLREVENLSWLWQIQRLILYKK